MVLWSAKRESADGPIGPLRQRAGAAETWEPQAAGTNSPSCPVPQVPVRNCSAHSQGYRARNRSDQALQVISRRPVLYFARSAMISRALRLIRVFHDMNQTELAKQLGISKSYLSEIESGEKYPTLSLIEKYSKTFDIPPSAILFFAENLGDPSVRSQARRFVAKKVLTLLQFIEERSGASDGKRKNRLLA